MAWQRLILVPVGEFKLGGQVSLPKNEKIPSRSSPEHICQIKTRGMRAPTIMSRPYEKLIRFAIIGSMLACLDPIIFYMYAASFPLSCNPFRQVRRKLQIPPRAHDQAYLT